LYIAKFYADNAEKYGKTLIFADRWYQCEAISDFLNQHGIRTGTVYSQVDADPEIVGERKKRKSDENSRVLEAFRKGELDVVINVRMLTEGTDVPDVKTVFITRQTTSQILLTQMVGRALRGPKFGGTDKAYLVFFIDEWKKLINWAGFFIILIFFENPKLCAPGS
jgi:superfamily II DNA or RNA helicase